MTTFFAPRRHPCPVTKVALRGVVPLQQVPVPALELADHPVVQVGGHDHPVPGGVRQLRALGGDTSGHVGPGPVVADHAGVVAGLELGHAGHTHTLVVANCGANVSVNYVTIGHVGNNAGG